VTDQPQPGDKAVRWSWEQNGPVIHLTLAGVSLCGTPALLAPPHDGSMIDLNRTCQGCLRAFIMGHFHVWTW
jgi:hypothetical protein